MAYFSALGGTGGTSATITVTYSEDFYGVTITATNGTTTLTKTATSSGTLVFDVSEGGTWVVSGTVEGATYSESVDVTFEYTAPPLVALPDGSTALPVNDIQMWLKCAGIRDKDYTTLSQVLADTETFIALCADSNACDYMARSTNWASGVADDSTAMLIVGKYNYCANALLGNSTWASAIVNSSYADSVISALVPTMTSNTTPSGECFGSSSYSSGYPYYYAFDNSSSTSWASSVADAVGSYLGYDFGTDVHIGAIKIIGKGTNNNPTNITVQGYDTEWHDISTFDVNTSTNIYGISNTSTYTKYRVKVNSFDGTQGTNNVGVQTLQFYGRTDNANYIPLVPKMTSNTTPSGECYGSSVESPKDYYYAFSTDSSKKWNPTVGSTNQYAAYDFGTAVVVNKARLKLAQTLFVGSTTSVSLKFVIQGSDSKTSDFTTLGSVTKTITVADANSYIDIEFDNSTAYRYLRLFTDDTAYWVDNSYQISINELQFYKAITGTLIHSAVEDSIFYMNDGSPVALCGIPVGDTIDVDLEAYKGQTLTLVSTVAKDPTNLSNDFSMNVRITPNITEIYLMPNKALYWYGYNGGIEAINSTNGWTWAATSATQVQPTFNNNNITITTTTSTFGGVGTSSVVDSGSKVHSITNTTGTGRIGLCEGKTNNTTPGSTTTSTGTSHTVLEVSFTSKYCTAYSVKVANTMRIDAFWYE